MLGVKLFSKCLAMVFSQFSFKFLKHKLMRSFRFPGFKMGDIVFHIATVENSISTVSNDIAGYFMTNSLKGE